MSLEEMAAHAAAAICLLSEQKKVGCPAMAMDKEAGVVTLTYPDGQVFEVRVTMLQRIQRKQ